MATPEEALSFIRRTWATREIDESNLTVTINWDERSQMVYVEVDDKFIHLRSPFARASEVDLTKALDVANIYILGVQKSDDILLVKHVIPIENLDESEVQIGLKMVCSIADDIEEALLGTDEY